MRRLRVTSQAIHICIKRLNLTAAQKEAAAAKAKEARALRRWESKADARNQSERNQELGCAEFARARNMPDVAGYEPAPEDDVFDLAERVVPEAAVVRTLAAVDEATTMLNRIIASGVVATDSTLLAAARKCAAHTASVATQVRDELGLDGGNVVSITSSTSTASETKITGQTAYRIPAQRGYREMPGRCDEKGETRDAND